MSKGASAVVSVAAAIAIPFAAPVIAETIGLSAAIGSALGSATAGSVLGGALVGATLGAAKGAIFGENVGKSALMGGLSGGIGGYVAAPSAATAAGASGGAGHGIASYSISPPAASLTSTMGGGVGLTSPSAFSGELATGLSDAAAFGPVDYSLAAGTEFPTVGVKPPMMGAGLSVPSSGFANVASSTAGAASSTPTTFVEALKQVPSQIAARFSDPKALADLTLRAAGQLAGSAFAGDGLSPEERQLLNAQTAELQKLQQTNQDLFNQRLQAAQQLMGESRYFDPEYFGLQSARRAQIADARAKRAGLRGLEDPVRQAEARRFDLATARDAATAFDVGYGTGVQGRLHTLTAGINAMPTGFPSSMIDYTSLRNAYSDAAERVRKKQASIGTLFGSLTGYYETQKPQGQQQQQQQQQQWS